MRNICLLLLVTVSATSCLSKLEDTSSETRKAVEQTRDLIDNAGKDGHLGKYIELMELAKSPSVRSGNAVKVIWNAAIEDLFILFGAPLPLDGEHDMLDANTPNVTLVSAENDPVRRTGGVTPTGWNDRSTGCKLAMGQLLMNATGSKVSQADKDAIPDRAWRCVLVCTAVAGAIPVHDDPALAQIDWPRDDAAMKKYKTVKADIEKLLREVAAIGKFTQSQKREMEWYITVRMHNNYAGASIKNP